MPQIAKIVLNDKILQPMGCLPCNGKQKTPFGFKIFIINRPSRRQQFSFQFFYTYIKSQFLSGKNHDKVKEQTLCGNTFGMLDACNRCCRFFVHFAANCFCFKPADGYISQIIYASSKFVNFWRLSRIRLKCQGVGVGRKYGY